jgi:hypothetical protein
MTSEALRKILIAGAAVAALSVIHSRKSPMPESQEQHEADEQAEQHPMTQAERDALEGDAAPAED